MANRYWVGGTANWDGTAGTKWALTSGGLGGQAVPTSADDVFFDNLSTGTCTIVTGNTGAKSINCTGFTGTLAGTAAFTLSGSLTLAAGMTYSYTGVMTINATATLTTAGKSLGSETNINGSGITVTLGDAWTTTKLFTLTRGTFNAANFNVTLTSFSSSNSNTRTVTMGSGTWTISGSWLCSTSTNLTVNANTSTISMTGSSSKLFDGGGRTYYNLRQQGTGALIISGANTFNDLTTLLAATTTVTFTAGVTQTFTNFTYSPVAPSSGIFQSSIPGSTYTLSKSSGTVNVSRLLIQDSIATGGATWNATDSVSLGNNTGWNITASTGRYWVGGTANWDATQGTKWSTSSGGLGGTTVPGLVDPAYFDAASGANTVTISAGNLGCAGIICTGFTGTLAGSSSITVNGNLTLVAGMVYTHTGAITTNSASTYTTAGKTLGSVVFNARALTLTLADACTLGTTNIFTLTAGTLNLNGNTLSTGIFNSDGSNTRAITFGSANIALTSTTASTVVLNFSTASNFTFTGTGAFTRNMAATAMVRFGDFAGGTTSNAPNLTVNAGSSALTIASGSDFKNVDFTGYSGTVTANNLNMAGNLTLSTGGTYTSVISTFLASGTLTSTGKTLGNTAVNGSGITVTLGDAANCPTLTLTSGTLNLAGFTFTATTSATTGAGTKDLTFNGGTLVCSAATTTAWNNANPTNFTTTAGTGTGIISMTAATAKTFVGGSRTYNCTLRQGGAGALTISGSNTFSNIDNSTQPATVTFTAGTTQTFTNFSLTGTAGNLITINSSSAGSQATLSKSSGTVSVDYLSIRDSNATGGAAWSAGANSTNVSNNTGWIFTAPPSTGNGNFLIFLN